MLVLSRRAPLTWVSPLWKDAQGMPLGRLATGVAWMEVSGRPIEFTRQQVRMVQTGMVAVEYSANQVAAILDASLSAREVTLVIAIDGVPMQRVPVRLDPVAR